MDLVLVSNCKCFGGEQRRYTHRSATLNAQATFSVFLPAGSAEKASGEGVPALYWLSGLTCTDENFSTKAAAQQSAAAAGIVLVIPDTSPRGDDVPDAEDGAWDFGKGAGMYVDADKPPFDKHFKMYSYITKELIDVVENNVIKVKARSISGHSMGGHGALMISLKEGKDKWSSCSAFAPISAPSKGPWGIKAFTGYLQGGVEAGEREYDSVALMKRLGSPTTAVPTLVDTGTADPWLEVELRVNDLVQANEEVDYGAEIRFQPGYEHGYYFVSTFIEEHMKFHAKHLL